MDLDVEENIYRIINGYYFIEVDNVNYKVVYPTLSQKRQAHCLYKEIIKQNRFDTKNWLSQKNIDLLLIRDNLWNEDKNKHYNNLLKQLENVKIELYLKFIDSTLRKNHKKLIQDINKQIIELNNDKYYYYYLTIEGYAQSIQNQFIIVNTVYKNDEPLYDSDWNNLDSKLVESISSEIYNKKLGLDEIKFLSKQELWRSFWSAGKENLFGIPVTQWNDEQILIVNISKSLDSIREHPECPSEDIINDSDALDGWMLYQHNKIQQDKKKQQLEERLGIKEKNKSAFNELFVITNDKEEAGEIFSLNDKQTQRDIQEIKKVGLSGEEKPWMELSHVKREIENTKRELLKNIPQ